MLIIINVFWDLNNFLKNIGIKAIIEYKHTRLAIGYPSNISSSIPVEIIVNIGKLIFLILNIEIIKELIGIIKYGQHKLNM